MVSGLASCLVSKLDLQSALKFVVEPVFQSDFL